MASRSIMDSLPEARDTTKFFIENQEVIFSENKEQIEETLGKLSKQKLLHLRNTLLSKLTENLPSYIER